MTDEEPRAVTSILIEVPADLLKQAMLDALRLDYQGELARLCEGAIREQAEPLSAFLRETFAAVLTDEAFRLRVRQDIEKRIHETTVRTAQRHVARLTENVISPTPPKTTEP